ncbi:AraC family transcriptional regulator [Alkalicoccobacillus porphyridii]|uniref:Helix-turn-helix domain-containing protein n=1 Tax=Alkalicoccobacillus porphyridii TaxID=2597270 RepID=A0A554A033_9BACI|nr:AraC family transcriptional regulator [Alkalicoccobacillus porphyridii]TSB47042.1 helix-turn-helix domain-containing protein [Alkalicoccobacillus porphyridii]
MEPIRKKLSPVGTMPFSILYNLTKGRKEELPDHSHEWCELIYIHSGKGTFFIDQTFLELEEGDLIFIPPNIIHKSILEAEQTLTSSVLFFSTTMPSLTTANRMILFQAITQAKEARIYRYKLTTGQQKIVRHQFDEIHQEKTAKNTHWEEHVSVQILMLVIKMSRWMERPVTEQESVPTNLEWLKNSLDYMDQHLHEPIRLKSLAKEANVSPVYFSKKFKRTIGMTISDFLAKKRLLRARELLIQTDESIQAIAEQLGYQSMPHFYRSFKKATGITPSLYRKEHKQ